MADNEQLVLSISADTRAMQRQLDKLVSQLGQTDNTLENTFNKAPPKIDNVAKSLNKTRFETANLAAQFQDIAVQLQGGQSPFTIALQQGTQIAQVLGRGGAGGTVELLKAGFSSLISPVSLATIGIIALGGAAVSYGMKALGAVDDLDEKLKAHDALIKGLKDAYGEAGKGIDTSVKEAIVVLQGLLNFKTDDIKKEFKSLSADISKSLSDFRITGIGPAVEENSRKFAAFGDAITAFKKTVKDGTPDVLSFRREVQQIADTSADEKTKALAKELLELTKKASGAQLAIESTAKAARNFSPDAIAAAEAGEKFAKAMEKLSGTVSPDLSDREKILKNYNDALEKAGSTEERVAAARAKNDQLAVLSANERKKAAEDAAKEAESAEKRFNSLLNASARQSAKTTAAGMAAGQGDGAIARLETEYRLTEAAQQAFGKVTDETKAKITAQAEAAGKAVDALARARVAASTEFNIKSAFLSPEDLQIAQQLAGIYGNNIPAALSSTEAAGIRAANTLRAISTTLQDVNRGIATDFVQQIRNGASAMDALKTAGSNALGKIADKLAQMAADNLWASAFGGSSGLGGFFGSLFGGSTAGATTVTGLGAGTGGLSFPMFANGTNNAPGGLALVGERGPEIVNLPKGSEVIPNHELSSMGGGVTVSVGGATVVVQGDASEKTLALIKGALKEHDATLGPKVVSAVQDAKKRRVLA